MRLVRSRGRFVVALGALAVALAASPALAQSPARFLAKEDILLYGLGLRVEPATQTVPKDIATIVSTFLQAPQQPQGLPPFAPDAVVKATLRGPGLPNALDLVAQPNSPFNIPPLTVAGVYTLENIRLESQGTLLLRATPESAKITVIDKLLVTEITARPLTAAEIREKGIVFDSSNFQAYNFTAAFALKDGGNTVKINVPVLLPTVQGTGDVATSTATIAAVVPPVSITSLKTVVPDTLKLATQVPNLTVLGFTLKAPELKGQNLMVPPIPGVIVIPGDIGFLNQYFSVMLMVGNAAPAGSNLSVTDLRADIVLPQGNDRVTGSADDPLRMAITERGESPRNQPIVQAGEDGKLGTADDILVLGPGDSGNAEFLVEGRREGSHTVEMSITGTLLGLPVGPVPITGRAIGAVLVRNPVFTLTFTHPELVVAGEQYALDVTVTNTSASPANFVSLNLYAPNVSGATVVGDPTREIESIPPGDSATVTFDLVSRLTGKVWAATLDSDENVSGRFQLKTSVANDGIPLSPDSLVLPKEANALPKSLRDAALGLLGKAWAVATAPAGALPKDVVRFSKQIVIDRAIDVAEAGFRVSLHEPLPASAAQLLMDFAGSNFDRIADLYPAADQPFHRDNFSGFDALRRSSARGDVFAAAVAGLLAPDLAAGGPVAFHRGLAERWGYRPGFISVLLAGQGGPAPFDVTLIDAQGRAVGGTGPDGKFVKSIPFSDVLAFTDASGQRVATLLLVAAPEPGAYRVRLTRVAGTAPDALSTLSILAPTADMNGDVRQTVFEGVTASSAPEYTPAGGDPVTFAIEMIGSDLAPTPAPLAGAASVVPDAPPSVVSVVQQAQADVVRCDPDSAGYPMGRIVAVLFSEEVTAASVQDRLPPDLVTAFAPEANRAVGVALQPGRRIAFVALREPFGPYVPRTMTVTGVEDFRGHALASWSGPMEATVGDNGAVVSGRIIQGDGTPVAGAEVRLFAVLPCGNGDTSKIGVSAKLADGEGRYSWDFVNSDLRASITAIEPGTEYFRSIPFDISRPGQRLNVDIVLLGRGTFTGRVFGPDNRTPLFKAQIRVTSLTDHSQFGATTDEHGAFAIAHIPVGNIFVEAVNAQVTAHYNFSEYIPFAGAIVSRDFALIAPEFRTFTAVYGDLSGHVLREDGATPVQGAPVVAYYQNGSQSGVACPALGDGVPPECAVGVATSAADGSFAFTGIPAGQYRVYAFDQAALSQGEVRYTLAAGAHTLSLLLSGGLATVRGIVVDSAGARVPGARVGGGLTLSTADANGEFVLTDVPVGRREIVAVSDALAVKGSATIDITRAGEIVNVTIVMPASGSVAGRVVLADGAAPAAGVAVYVFRQVPGGFDIIGQATTDSAGAYRIDHVLPGEYQVSAFNGDFSDGNVVTAVLRYDKQVLRADIRFRGAGGRVSGTVFDSDGNTPLAARVGLSGLRVRIAGGRVGVGFQPVANYAIVDTGFDGTFSFSGLFVGDFTLRAVGAFSPDPIASSGRIAAPGEAVTVNLRLTATSQVAGIVYQPDGVTPAPNVNVTFKSDAFRLVCSGEGADGDPKCEAVPQGVQAEYAVSDAQGRFLIPLVNAGAFTLSFEDPATGKVAQVKASVRPGERAEIPARLLGRGALTVRVLSSDGRTPIPGARVDLAQTSFPTAALSMVADAQGVLLVDGGDALTEGEVAIFVRDVRNGFTGRASATISRDGEQVSVNAYIYDAWGTVSGTVFKSDGITPVPNAEVVVSVGGKALGYTVADANGQYSQDTVPLGPFSVDVFEAATSRIGYASGRIDLDKQHVVVNVVEAAIGLVTGTALDSAIMAPLPGWTVSLGQRLGSGRSLPSLRGMTAADGRFSFPGVAKGVFSLSVSNAGSAGSAAATGEIYTEGQVVDVPLLVRIVHPLYGGVEGTVRNPDGTPAAYATVEIRYGPATVAAADGTFTFAQLPLGRYQILARAQASANAGSVWTDLQFNGDLVQVTIPMVGLTAVHGQVVYADNSPAAGARVVFDGSPSSGCDVGGCQRFADANGEFAFIELPSRTFTLWAEDPVRGLKGSVGGPLNPGEDKALRVVLQPSAVVQGRVLTAGGLPAAGVTCELIVGGQHLFLGTGSDGRFSYQAVPLSTYAIDFSDPVGTGIARRTGTLTGDLDFGDILLDEAPPQVVSLTPAASAARVPLDQVLTIVFSEPIDPGGVNAAGIALAGPSGPVTAVLALGAGDTTVTLTPLAPLKDEARYTLKITGIKDRLAKVMPDYAASFTTVDITPPALLDLSPAQGASGVPIYSPVRVKFSEPIDPAAFGSASPLLLTIGGVAVSGRFDYLFGNTVVAFTPALPLADGAVYRVQLPAARDLTGNAQAQGLDFTFSTTDRTPPLVGGLSSLTGPTVIEGTVARVRPQLGAAFDVSVVDYYVNGVAAGSSRTAPFDFAFQAIPAFGAPGDAIAVAAIATDTSGNRGPISATLAITVVADQPPAIAITAPAGGSAFRNGARVTVSLQAADDVGLVTLGYKALTGKPQDAGTVQVSPAAVDRTASFAFDVPMDAAPGATIQIQASAVDSKGQTTPAAPVAFTVLDAVAPAATLSGGATGDKVKAGQAVTVALNVSDAGGVKQVTFAATGAAAASETRPIAGGPTALVTAFTFTVSPTAATGDTIALDATATDLAGNTGTAARVVLTVGDVTPPTLSLRTSDGSTSVLPGQTVDLVAQSSDDQAVARVDLSGQGAFTVSDSRQVSPPSNSATTHFPVIIPAGVQPGALLTLAARATDVAGNVSGPATLVLQIGSTIDFAMPASVIVLAGDSSTLAVRLSVPARPGGQLVSFSSTAPGVASVPGSITIPEGQTDATVTVTAVAGGTASIRAFIQGALRAATTVAVQGGVVSGVVYDDLLNPVAGADVTVGTSLTATTDQDGFYRVTGFGWDRVLVKAIDPISRKRGSVTVSLSGIGGFARNANVVLIAAGAVAGTVFEADGTTPAGAGIQIDIYDQAQASSSIGTTFTGDDSRYEFPVVTQGAYRVEARSTNGRRGRAFATVAAGQDVAADISYLGAGSVTGVVRDGGGAAVPNAQVVFNAWSVFGAAPAATINAGPDGSFSFTPVFVGSFAIRATDPRNGQAGAVSGVVGRDQEAVAIDVYVASYGSVSGTVYRSDGTTTVANASVSLQNGQTYQAATTDSAGRYEFPVVPLGTSSIRVSEPATRGVGRTTATLTTNGESQTADVTLVPQGTLVVTVTDAIGSAVAGAFVTVTSTGSGFTDAQSALTGADGRVVIAHVLAGAFTLSATKDGLTGAAAGTLGGGATVQVTARLEPVGSVAGTVFMPDGQTPAAGSVSLRVAGVGNQGVPLQQAALAADGTYRFDRVPMGRYQVFAYDQTGRWRAVTAAVQLSSQGQVGTADAAFVGLGTVAGRVLNIDSSSASNTRVELRSLNALFGTYRSVITDAAGYYTVAGVPVGRVSVLAGSVEQGLFAEAYGSIGSDGQTVTLDLLLKNNSTYFPVTLHDANAMRFEVGADGMVKQGAPYAFDLAKGGGLKLEIETGGVTSAFAGSSIGTLEADGRQVVARQQGLAGLDVTRRVYVPIDGYFARYLDVLTNPGADPVTVNVWVTSYVGAERLLATSSGDDVIDVADEASADRWFTIDDASEDPASRPPMVFVFDGAGGSKRAALAAFAPSNSAVWRWDSVTVPPGGSVAFLHFLVQQHTRAAAQASAERLALLPPEALASVRQEELAAVQNFAVPADGVSPLAALPSVSGVVLGRTLEADGATPVPNTSLTFRSASPYFTRTQTYYADANGLFRIEAVLDGSSNAFAVPAEAFSLSAVYPGTGVPAPAVAGTFAEGELLASQDILFTTTAGLRGSVRRADGTVVNSGTVTAAGTWNAAPYSRSASIRADGSFAFTGLPPIALVVTASVPHAQGSSLTGSAGVTLTAGTTSDVLVTLPAVGAVQGTVRTGGGTAAASITVKLAAGAFSRTTATDTAGAYTLAAVPAGTYSVTATEPASGLATTADVTVSEGQTSSLDLQLVSVGVVRGTVRNASNAVVASVPVTLVTSVPARGTLTAITNASGAYQFTGVPVGSFLVSATSSTLGQYGEVAGAVASDGQQVVADITMASNVITLPRTRYDANSLSYEIQQNGRVRYGYSSIFRGPTNAAAGDPYGASMLSLVAGGAETAFAGAATAIGEQGNREWAIRQQGVAGLDVTRKVYLPETGYFARYLEILSNPGAAPVTVDVKVNSSLGYASYDYWWGWQRNVPSLKGTSSGDATLDVTGASPDRWAVFDDSAEADIFGPNQPSSTLPAAAFVFDGAGGAARVASAAITQPVAGNLLYQWNGVTVPAGGRVILMHFVLQQSSKATGLASAERLVQLPPEAIAGINDDERALIANFAVPADGTSALADLPALTGTVTGNVVETDGAIVPYSTVRFSSSIPYYSRMRTAQADVNGAFSFRSAFGTGTNTAIPIAPFTLTALHRTSSIESPPANGAFAAGAATAAQDIVFTNTASIVGTLRRHTGAAVPSNAIQATLGAAAYSAWADATGAFAFRGLPPGTWALQATLSTNSWLVTAGTATAAAGQKVSQDLVFPPTGRVLGRLYRATGEAAAYTYVYLERADGSLRSVYQDTGAFEFPDTPPGTFKLYAADNRTGARAQSTVTVVQDQDTVQDLTLPAAGSLDVQVNFARGAAAGGARIDVKDAGTNGSFGRTVYADAAGRATVNNVAAGPVTVRAYYPSDTNFLADVETTLASEGEIVPVVVTLPSVSTVQARAVVSAGAVVANVSVSLLDQSGATIRTATTSATGIASLGLAANGASYSITGQRYVNSYSGYYVTGQTPAFSPAGDGDTNTIDVTLPAVANSTVAVVKPDGTSFGSSALYVKNAIRPNFEIQGYTNSTTGTYLVPMPEGAFTVRVKDYNTGASLVDHSGTIAPEDEGRAMTITVVVGAVTGTVAGQIFAADGVTPLGSSRVRLINAMDQQQLRSTTTGTDGRYTFANITAGTGGFIVRVLPPSSANDATAVDTPGSFTTAGETVTLNVTMPFASMTISGTGYTADGVTNIGYNRVVEVRNPAGTVLASGRTSTSGGFGPFGVLASTAGVRVRVYDQSGWVFGEQVQLPGTAGGAFTVNVNVPVYVTTLQGNVWAADAATGVSNAKLVVRNASGAAIETFWANASGAFSATVFAPAGEAMLAASYEYGITSDRTEVLVPMTFGTAGTIAGVNITLPLSVVRGHARYADRTDPVSLNWLRTVGRDSRTRREMVKDGAGNFTILGTPPGPFQVYASESFAPYSTGAASSVITDIAVPVDVDVVLPATGFVDLTIRNAAGQPLSDSAGLSLPWDPSPRRQSTDTAGHVRVQVPSGPVSLQACPSNQGCATVSGTVPPGAGGVRLELAPPPTGTITVRLLRPDGTTPYASKWAWVESRSGAGWGGYWSNSATTDASGRFTMTGVPAGVVFVDMWDSNTTPGIRAPVTVVAGQTTTVDLVGGSGVYTPAIVSGGITFNPATSGSLNSGPIGALGSPYNGSSYYMYVNDRYYYQDADMAGLTAGGTQIETGPDDANALLMSRKVAAPGNKGYVRYLETVHNPTGVPAAVTVQIYPYLRDVNVMTAAASTGGRYLITGPAAGISRAAVANVIAGAGEPQVLPGVSPVIGSSYDYVWATEIPPGGTVSFLHFSVPGDPADLAGLQARAQALVDLSDPDALAGLTDEEKSRILNFIVPGAAPRVTGSIGGVVVAPDGTTPIAGATVRAMDAFTGYAWASVTTDAAGAFQFDAIPNGDHGVAVAVTMAEYPGKSAGAAVTLTQAGQTVSGLLLRLDIGQVSGRVTAAGTGVASPVVLFSQTTASGAVTTRRAQMTGSDGRYVVLGLTAGPFTLAVTDASGQVGTTAQGTYDGVTPVSLDVALPAGAVCVAPPAGLRGFWRGEADAQDSVHTGSDGMLQGGAAIGPARVGNGLAFDGDTALVTIPDDAGSLRPTTLTVSAWVKFNSLDSAVTPSAGEQDIVFKKKGTIGPKGWLEAYALVKTRMNAGDDRFAFYLTTPDEQDLRLSQVSQTSVQAGRFYHVVATADGAVGRLYVDGILEATFPYPYPVDAGAEPLYVGGTDDPAWDPRCDCVVDEVQVFDRALTAPEVQGMYAATSAGVCSELQQLPATLPPSYVGTAVFDVLRALNGTAPVTFASNDTPPGLVLGSDGRLTGVPTEVGTFSFNVWATDFSGGSAWGAYSKDILACYDLAAGAVSLWSAEGDATDSFAVNDSLLGGSTAFAAGKSGQAFSFAYGGATVNTTTPPLDLADTFTIEFWAWPTATRGAVQETVAGTGGASGTQRYAITPEIRTDGAGMGVSVGTNGVGVFEHAAGYLPSLLSYSTGESSFTGWTHIAVVYENKTPKLYVNGVLRRTGLTSQQPRVFASKSFGDPYGYGPYYGGLDEVALYNRALTPEEIQLIYAAGGQARCRTVQR